MTEAVLVDAAGQRAVAAYQDDAMLSRAPLPTIDLLDGAQVVLAHSSWVAGAKHMLAAAEMRDVATVAAIDAAPRGEIDAMCRSADHVLFNGSGLCVYAGAGSKDEALREVQERLAGKVLVALGTTDVALIGDGPVAHLSLPELTLLEARGSSGAFHGAYALAIGEGQTPMAAARFAAAVTTLTVKRSRNEPHYPSRADVGAFVASCR